VLRPGAAFIFLTPLFLLSSPLDAKQACIQPLGRHDAELAERSAKGLKILLGLEVRILPPVDMPKSAWYPPRSRHRAERILEFLDARNTPGCDILVGFTALDISTTKGDAPDWGVFGLGALSGRSCVVSTLRLTRGGITRDRAIIRTIKVVNHEVGHVFGLDHCPTPGCLMEDARGTVRTVDNETGMPCDACRKQLEATGLRIPRFERVDWDSLIAR
jgi:archaemetzincin